MIKNKKKLIFFVNLRGRGRCDVRQKRLREQNLTLPCGSCLYGGSAYRIPRLRRADVSAGAEEISCFLYLPCWKKTDSCVIFPTFVL
ncbi:MAG TPA: hypothetical protein DE060_07190 [Lentisphaeria bacterium]|nr:hypothetical protein [Lentisphaeria bacterium]HCG48975.1 hypothetical protein [Lentisphaeria bacterium]